MADGLGKSALTVSRGGTTSVAPDELEAAGVMLGRLSAEATSMTIELASIDRIATRWSLERMRAPVSAALAEDDIDQAQIVLVEIQSIASVLQWSLQSAADGYGFAELFVRQLFGGGGSLLSPATLLTMASPAGLGAGVLAVTDPQMRNHPAFVATVRDTLMALPVGLAALAAGIAGVGTAVGLVRHTPVQLVAQTKQPAPSAPPTSYEQLIDRIPTPTDSAEAQIVVEKYEVQGEPDAFIAYLAGTETFNPFVTDEPLDMESNLLNLAGDTSASAEVVRQALTEAGADAGSPVLFVGHSQGGAAEAQVAASGEFDVQGILTFGSPTGQIDIPSDIPAVLVEHDDDVVPAFGGRQDNAEAVHVTRRVFADGQVPIDQPVPAHLRTVYAETARMMDESNDAQLHDALVQFTRMTDGWTSVTQTSYEFERVTELSASSRR